MGLSVNWSPEATEDLESIAEYIGRDSEFYARAVVSKILATSRKIPEHPILLLVGIQQNILKPKKTFNYT